jgi:FkbM family methyltransferase
MRNDFITNVLSQHMLNNKINVPEWAKRVKLDIGTSIAAPNSEVWLNEDGELCVFAFEPNAYNVDYLKKGGNIWPIHLNPNKVNQSFFCFHCALSNTQNEKQNFYCTAGDSGTSSLFKPKYFQINEITEVSVIKLSDFFDHFPWDRIPYIDQVKIDAQSSDFNIIKGMGDYLVNNVVYIDIETHTNHQYENNENPLDLKDYLESRGYECVSWGINSTFFNKRFNDIKHNINYKILGD